MPWRIPFRTPPVDKIKKGKMGKLVGEKAIGAYIYAVDRMKHKGDEPYIISGNILVYTKKEWEEYMAAEKE